MADPVGLAGAAFGVGVQFFANTIQRIPATRFPYMYVAWGVGGYYLLPWYDNQVSVAREKVAEKQREKMEKNITFAA